MELRWSSCCKIKMAKDSGGAANEELVEAIDFVFFLLPNQVRLFAIGCQQSQHMRLHPKCIVRNTRDALSPA